MKWRNVTSDGLPRMGEPVLLFSNGVIQQAAYYLDATDGDLSLDWYWDSEDCRIDEGIEIKESDRWLRFREIPNPK